MLRIGVLLLAIIFITGCVKQIPATVNNINTTNMKLFSNDFQNNTKMDPKFTCDGDHIRPHLAWSEIPEGTKSLSLGMFDPDAPGNGFLHWLVVNLPVQELKLNSLDALPASASQMKNDAGKLDYHGPCPPSGEHRYQFTLYALDVESINPNDYNDFLQQANEHLVDKVTITGLYQRQ